jgi:hypothetical protein
MTKTVTMIRFISSKPTSEVCLTGRRKLKTIYLRSRGAAFSYVEGSNRSNASPVCKKHGPICTVQNLMCRIGPTIESQNFDTVWNAAQKHKTAIFVPVFVACWEPLHWPLLVVVGCGSDRVQP